MSKSKKDNPRNKPMTNAEREMRGFRRGLVMAWTVLFTVLLDKEGYKFEDVERVWRECEYLTESIKAGRVNVTDLRRVLIDEYNMNLEY